MLPPQKIFDFFYFKIVHSGAFSYINCKVLFAIKCSNVIMVFLAIDSDTDIKTSNFHQSCKPCAVRH